MRLDTVRIEGQRKRFIFYNFFFFSPTSCGDGMDGRKGGFRGEWRGKTFIKKGGMKH